MTKKYDLLLFLLVMILMLIGGVMVYSSSAVVKTVLNSGTPEIAAANEGQFEIQNALFIKQVIFVFIGTLVLMFGLYFDLEKAKTVARVLWPVILILLLSIPFLGTSAKGATRWINLGWFRFNPAEIAKIVMIVFVADLISKKKDKITDFKQGLLPILVVLYSLVAGVLVQKDLSTAIILTVVGLSMIYLGGAKIKHLLAITGLNIMGGIAMVLLYSYRMKRLIAFFSPETAHSGSVYQANQSLIALGNGGISGIGLGNSYQKYFFLPEAHTDYILSIIGEEWGVVGVMIILFLFFALFWRGIKIARRADGDFQKLLAWGITLNFTFYALMHMAIVTNMMPSTGLGLPFISYGGSALVSNAVLASILLNISGNYRERSMDDLGAAITWQEE